VCMMDLSGFVGFVDLCGGFRDLVVFLCFGDTWWFLCYLMGFGFCGFSEYVC